jgi:hypothetical protein
VHHPRRGLELHGAVFRNCAVSGSGEYFYLNCIVEVETESVHIDVRYMNRAKVRVSLVHKHHAGADVG